VLTADGLKPHSLRLAHDEPLINHRKKSQNAKIS
jgi:hypothetical protein